MSVQVFELVRCADCGFHKPAGEACSMCELLADEDGSDD